jgi:hypothetical protein
VIPPGSRAVLPFLSLVALLACGQDRPSASRERRERVLEKSPLPTAPQPAAGSPYEADGRTLALAPEPLLGVAVPRTARVLSKRPNIGRALVERVPFGAVERFYQKYLQTGRVERSRLGLRFADATPKAPGNPRARVEVHLQATARGTSIAIYDESPSNTKAPQGDEAVRQARGDQGPIDFTKRIPGITE